MFIKCVCMIKDVWERFLVDIWITCCMCFWEMLWMWIYVTLDVEYSWINVNVLEGVIEVEILMNGYLHVKIHIQKV